MPDIRRSLSTSSHRKLSCFGHVCRNERLLKTILHGTIECGCRRGRPSISSRSGRVIHFHCCCALQKTEANEQPSPLRRLSEYTKTTLGRHGSETPNTDNVGAYTNDKNLSKLQYDCECIINSTYSLSSRHLGAKSIQRDEGFVANHHIGES